MRRCRFTLVGLVFAIALYLVSVVFELDLFEKLAAILQSLEDYEIDEFVIPIATFFCFAFWDMKRRGDAHKVDLEKLKIYKAMLASTHHILNNFLNQMQLFRIAAENTPGFPPKTLALYDRIIDNATAQLDALGSVATVSESTIKESIAPQTGAKDGGRQDEAADADG